MKSGVVTKADMDTLREAVFGLDSFYVTGKCATILYDI
jgi:hypothetical protein